MSRWVISSSARAASINVRLGLPGVWRGTDNTVVVFRLPCLRSLRYRARKLFDSVARASREKRRREPGLLVSGDLRSICAADTPEEKSL